MKQLYCPECGNYLEGGDGCLYDCFCGWKQPEEQTATPEIDQLRDEVERLKGALEDARDTASIALRKAWQLGQTYWQQADSESFSQNAKSNETQARFQQLVDETREEIWKGD